MNAVMEKHDLSPAQREIIELTQAWGARNYDPLPVVLATGEGCWVEDVDGRRYLDCLAAYSAVNQGHRHPRIMQAVADQCGRLTLTSRAFHHDRLGRFLQRLCEVAQMEVALPMNTGAEAVETAVKLARKWGYEVRGVPRNKAEIVCCNRNFHGRTMMGVSLSSDAHYHHDFGPVAPGFNHIAFGDAAALAEAINPNTVAVLLEPIQGEGGIIVPPEGYLREVRRLCDEHGILMIADEIQTGLGRTGRMFCHQHTEGAFPDVMTVGKALGGGVLPVSAALASRAVMDVFRPGDHGSTFGGNPLACAVAEAALDVIVDEDLAGRAREQGERLMKGLQQIDSDWVVEVRGRGLLVGIELAESGGPARAACEALLERGILCKETKQQILRLAPPLTITADEIDWLVEQLDAVL
ncbi:MAG: ornithine--oxo-acid transaminase [Halofilum sp. (in: g-proteobacteria)]|nr:ornithine--oxo-acid transaminase [Halofilum sp. (in: g-proteobacteria)]